MKYRVLGFLAMVCVPSAAITFFGWRVYTETMEMTGAAWLAVPVGIATGTGLELVGIYAGIVASRLWEDKNPLWRVAAGIMVLYVAVGMYELRGTIGMVVFLITPAIYVLTAMHGMMLDRQAHDDRIFEFELAEKQKDRELTRQLREERQAAKLRKANGKQPESPESNRKARKAAPGDYAKWPDVPPETRKAYATMTPIDIARLNPRITKRTARNWHARAAQLHLNGKGT